MPTTPAIPTKPTSIKVINQALYQLVLADAEQTLNVTYSGGVVSDAASAVRNAATIQIPPDSTVNFPVGTAINIIDDSPAYVFLQAIGGVSLFWNAEAPQNPVDKSVVQGGRNQRTRPSGRLSQSRLVKKAANVWQLLQ